jgi:hypothetical protein
MLSAMIPAVLVASSHDGLRIMPDVLCNLRQRDGLHSYTNGELVSAQWCSHDLVNCVDDLGFGCPIDECTHVWWVHAGGPGVFVESAWGLPVEWSASHLDGTVGSGTYAGPPDWNVDGVVDSNDFFGFMDSFFGEGADYDMDGVTTSQDLFVFLGDFEG